MRILFATDLREPSSITAKIHPEVTAEVKVRVDPED